MIATIEITSPQQTEELLCELLMVVHNLRYWTKKCQTEGGKNPRINKKGWEVKCDEILIRVGLAKEGSLKTVNPIHFT